MTVWKKDACCDGIPRITIPVRFLMLAVTAGAISLTWLH